MNQETENQILQRLEALETENAMLRLGRGVPAPPPDTTLKVVFTALAVAEPGDYEGAPKREIRGEPDGKTVELRADIAEAWIRRGKAYLADSAEARAWLKDRAARDKATQQAAEQQRQALEAERKRQTELDEAAEAARLKDAASG